MNWKQIINEVFFWFVTEECISCGLIADQPLCTTCRSKLKYFQLSFNNYCFACKKTLTLFNTEFSIYCNECMKRSNLSDVCAIYLNTDIIQKIIQYSKNFSGPKTIQFLITTIHPMYKKRIQRLVATSDIIIVSPSSITSFIKRGFIIPLHLAHQLFPSSEHKIVYCFKKKSFYQQKQRSFQQRLDIHKKHPISFSYHLGRCSKSIKENLKVKKRPFTDLNCLIIDDIITTGATIFEISQELQNLGAISVSAIALAITPTKHLQKAQDNTYQDKPFQIYI